MENIPGPDATWAEIETFAVTFNGYARFGKGLDELASLHRRNGTIPSSLDELRGCLFFEQRLWRHWGSRPDERGMAHVRALLEGISVLQDVRLSEPSQKASPDDL